MAEFGVPVSENIPVLTPDQSKMTITLFKWSGNPSKSMFLGFAHCISGGDGN